MNTAPPEMSIETADISRIPLYDGDVEARGIPEPVAELRERIRAADALLIVTPEYNYSIPGVLKNAIDWASRPPHPPLTGKPTAVMGASPGRTGTLRAQLALRQAALGAGMLVMTRPEVLVSQAHEKFSPEGELIDERTLKAVSELLLALTEWTQRLAGARTP